MLDQLAARTAYTDESDLLPDARASFPKKNAVPICL
jgi:hypothetical protein